MLKMRTVLVFWVLLIGVPLGWWGYARYEAKREEKRLKDQQQQADAEKVSAEIRTKNRARLLELTHEKNTRGLADAELLEWKMLEERRIKEEMDGKK